MLGVFKKKKKKSNKARGKGETKFHSFHLHKDFNKYLLNTKLLTRNKIFLLSWKEQKKSNIYM